MVIIVHLIPSSAVSPPTTINPSSGKTDNSSDSTIEFRQLHVGSFRNVFSTVLIMAIKATYRANLLAAREEGGLAGEGGWAIIARASREIRLHRASRKSRARLMAAMK